MINPNNIKEEFKKIAWLSKKDTVKQTVIVILAIIIIGIIIALADYGIQSGLDGLLLLGKE